MLKPLFRSVVLPRLFLTALSLAALATASTPALSHEFWIEPEKYQVKSDDSLQAGLRNGQMFKGARLPYFAERIVRFDTVQDGIITPYQGRMGDMPALVLEGLQPGLLIALHETTTDLITYETWQAFADFSNHQGFQDVQARHQQRDLPEHGFGERYSRHTKLLVSVDHGAGADRAFGLETELVALQNPYTLPASTGPAPARIQILLLYQGKPRPLAQVEIFERAPDGSVQSERLLTDNMGVLQLSVRSEHSYLLNAVVLRPLMGDPEAVWQTLWASLVFALP
ncbi:DUF4198 domain-containing protein [Pseudophaeobacter sp.]|uniref:DUF4198 domain-containing protein n=1 Tax=Pseudophaeobacter sp. TaxID=1971739 RepID=UPI00329794EF